MTEEEFIQWYSGQMKLYKCEKCGKQGVCEDGIDVFVALLCQECYDKLWLEYVEVVSR